MARSWLVCCVQRDNAGEAVASSERNAGRKDAALRRQGSWETVADPEEYVTWHECFETEEELMSKKDSSKSVGEVSTSNSTCWFRRTPRAAEWSTDRTGRRSLTLCPENPHGTPKPFGIEPASAAEKRVAQATREEWEKRQKSGTLDEEVVEKLKQGFPELEEWTQPVTVRRMLRAMEGSEADATNLLVGAIECRVRQRDILRSMVCAVTCDMRVIGRDIDQRPTVYICARNDQSGLKDMIPQVFLAFEAATEISVADGQFVLVADMHGFATTRYMDVAALRELAGTFGTVFAERLNYILIVDFSFFAQAFWSLIKPMLSERTQKKINFVDEAEARKIAQERFAAPTCTRILSSFDINRDARGTAEERNAHAKRTAICDVPLGCLRMPGDGG